MFRQSIEVAAEPDVLFDLTQDYSRRLAWDPFLKEARLLGEAESPGVGVRAWCVARNGLGMETEYVSFNPPGACSQHHPSHFGRPGASGVRVNEMSERGSEGLRSCLAGRSWYDPLALEALPIQGRDAMRLPRFSIAWIMAVVVVAAVDLAAIRALDGTGTVIGGLFGLGSLPMASILVLGIPSLVKGLRRRGEIPPFLIGFEGLGGMALLLYTGSAILVPDRVAAAFISVAESLLDALGLDAADASDPGWQLVGLFVGMLILLLPQLLVALIGGWLTRRYRIKIIIERRAASGPETTSPQNDSRAPSFERADVGPRFGVVGQDDPQAIPRCR